MSGIVKRTVEGIGTAVLAKVNASDGYEAGDDGEFTKGFWLTAFGEEVECDVTLWGRAGCEIKCSLCGDRKNIDAAVTEWVKSHVNAERLIRDLSFDMGGDEWNDHGFQDEADYWRWKL